jgi:oligo-1,6-glucosidase/alpha-glucosidase
MHHINLSVRDAARGLMQWDDSDNVGFTEGVPWTLFNRETGYNVKDQEKDENSILNFYRDLIELKKTDLFQQGSYEIKDSKETVYAYEREFEGKRGRVYSNFSDKPTTISLNKEWSQEEIVLENDDNSIDKGELRLAPFGTIVFVKE